MLWPIAYAASVVSSDGTKLYIMGGNEDGNVMSSSQVSMQKRRENVCYSFHLLLKMYNLISICFDNIQVLNLSKMEWDLGPKLPEPLWGHCSVMFGGNLVVIGGWSTSQRQYGNKLDSMTSAYVLTGSSWTSLLPLRHGRSTHGCTVTNFRVKD